MTLALGADNMSGLLRILSKQDTIADGVATLHFGLRKDREMRIRIHLNKEPQMILKSFVEVDPVVYYRQSLMLRSPSTGTWILSHEAVQRWRQEKGSRLWVHGIPGAGKTILASSLIESLHQLRSSQRSC